MGPWRLNALALTYQKECRGVPVMVRNVMVSLLIREHPHAYCHNCRKKVSEEPEENVWAVWHDTMMYCPACTREEGIVRD